MIGYARSRLTDEGLRARLRPFLGPDEAQVGGHMRLHALCCSTKSWQAKEGHTETGPAIAQQKSMPAACPCHSTNLGKLSLHTTYCVGCCQSSAAGSALVLHLLILSPRLFIHLPTHLQVNKFLERCSYVAGTYDASEGFQALEKALREHESKSPCCPIGRLYYLALPPSVYPEVAKG